MRKTRAVEFLRHSHTGKTLWVHSGGNMFARACTVRELLADYDEVVAELHTLQTREAARKAALEARLRRAQPVPP